MSRLHKSINKKAFLEGVQFVLLGDVGPLEDTGPVLEQIVVEESFLHLALKERTDDLVEVSRVLPLDEQVQLVASVLGQVSVLLLLGETRPLADELELAPVAVA